MISLQMILGRVTIRVWATIFLSAGMLAGAATAAMAQASVDPDLPNAPLYHRRTFLIFPGYETVHQIDGTVPRLKVRQKFELAYRKTVDPSFLAQAAIFAAASQPGFYGPQYGPGAGAYAERFGYYTASIASSNLFSAGLLPSVLHQDPRYFRKGTGSVAGRTWWAFRSQFICRGDNGYEAFNGSKVIGYGMASALSVAYGPGGFQSSGKFAESYGTKFGVNFIANLFREFGGVSERARDPKFPK
jgi:hypothetical protein